MGLKIHTLAEIPDSISKNYYLYILDYYNWDEPIGNTLRENFDKIAEFAANNNSVVIQGMAGSHFYSELMSWESINGIDPLELLPALMITTLHPKYFIDGNNKQLKGKNIPKDKFVFLEIRKICQRPQDVVALLEKIFQDIRDKKAIQDFKVKKELKGGVGKILNDALILEPNIGGDAMALAEKYGKNKYVWRDNVENFILLKSNEEYFTDPVCKNGYFRGIETYNFVRDITSRFEQYKKKIKK